MNPKRLCAYAGILILLLFVLTGCGGKQEGKTQTQGTGKADQPIVLKFATIQPETHPTNVTGAIFFMKRVEELTNGKIKFQHYPAEQLGKAADMLKLVQGGTADIAYIGPTYMAGKLPLSSVGEIPGIFTDPEAASKALWKVTKDILYEQELKQYGVRPIVVSLFPPYYAFSTKKPIKSLDALKGMKIRVPGGPGEEAAVAVGAVPVTLPANQAYEALQRGVLDGMFTTFAIARGYKLEELLKYAVAGGSFGSFTNIYCINEKVWESLPDDVKKAMEQAGEETVVNMGKGLAEENQKWMKQWEQQKIMTVYHLTPEEEKQWLAKVEPVQKKWIEDMEKKGYPAQKVVDAFKKAYADYASGR